MTAILLFAPARTVDVVHDLSRIWWVLLALVVFTVVAPVAYFWSRGEIRGRRRLPSFRQRRSPPPVAQ